MITVDEERAAPLRAAALLRGRRARRIKFRVGPIAYVAFSRDETLMGFAFPEEERRMLVETYPVRFQLPRESDMRFNLELARLDALQPAELEELVLDAWRLVVPLDGRRNARSRGRRGSARPA